MLPEPMATTEKPADVVGSQAGLGAAISTESHGELGELDEIRARGYWELVLLRFRRDKVAIGSGIFIILMILAAFAGAPIAKHYIGHGPNDIFASEPHAVSVPSLLPGGPGAHILNPYTGKHDILLLGAANRL